ncbi:hypothetical protein [Haliscomenobacter hydrossis]|uniref:Transmembrane protein n=1 Tax=Haliscomenobacter hydrossis (strain ATCC 27775 / DSM 1100 / LMG 10767 / O) TaxID=760192 RepID=F4L081_HALH1|nr:hypothetical protein [Haliscomenobacter hydrossis]AEE53754.1 hypothetical protein Halhy_5931 [Haliscomenobacter hydrossis DSM 1100]
MSNPTQTGNNVAKDAAKRMIQELTDYAPHTLLAGMAATFILLGYLQYQFYLSVFSSSFVAAFIAGIIQALRFAAGLTSANFFKMGRSFLAVLVMGLSVWLTWFENQEVVHISQAIADNFASSGYTQYRGAIELVLRVIVWVGPVLELFMGLTLGSQGISSMQKAMQDEMDRLATEHTTVLQTLQSEIDQLTNELSTIPQVDAKAMQDEIDFLKNQLAQQKSLGNGKVTRGKKKATNGHSKNGVII